MTRRRFFYLPVKEDVMFQSDTHLPHILAPVHYSDPGLLEREVQKLMMPAWHCVGNIDDLSQGKECYRFELFGKTYEIDGAHRSIRMAATPSQSRSDRLYFSGRVQVVGKLVFVSLSNAGQSLREFLGTHYDYIRDLFGGQWQRFLVAPQIVKANWKGLVENILESYHLEEVHKNTFRTFPSADVCFHDLHDSWSGYTERNESEHSHLRGGVATISRLLKVNPHPEYRHIIIYPNCVIARMGLFNWIQTILPITPVQSMNYWQFFFLRGEKRNPVAWATSELLKNWGRRFFMKALEEDNQVLKSVQAGLQSVTHPKGGLISAREERIFHFQRHAAEQTGVVPVTYATGRDSAMKWSETC